MSLEVRKPCGSVRRNANISPLSLQLRLWRASSQLQALPPPTISARPSAMCVGIASRTCRTLSSPKLLCSHCKSTPRFNLRLSMIASSNLSTESRPSADAVGICSIFVEGGLSRLSTYASHCLSCRGLVNLEPFTYELAPSPYARYPYLHAVLKFLGEWVVVHA